MEPDAWKRRGPSHRFLNLYEKTNLISARAEQISHGASTTLDASMGEIPASSIRIAELEFEAGLIPMDIVRQMPRGGETYRVDSASCGGRSYDDDDRACPREPEINNKIIWKPTKPYRDMFVAPNGLRGDRKNNLQMTSVGKFSGTPLSAKRILKSLLMKAEVGRDTVVLEACACVGTDTSLFASLGAKVVLAVEYDAVNYRALVHNMDTLGIADRVRTIPGDVVEVLRTPPADHAVLLSEASVAYFDPPWGGPSYHEASKLRLRVGGVFLHDIIALLPVSVRFVVLKLPFNYDFDSLVGAGCRGGDNGFERQTLAASGNIRFAVLRRRTGTTEYGEATNTTTSASAS